MENEIMNYEEVEVIEDEVVADEKSGMGTGKALLIGAGVAIAAGAIVKSAKNLWAKYKAKKELRKPDTEIEITDEEIAEITAK